MQVAQGSWRNLPAHWPLALSSLVKECWTQDPTGRPSAEAVGFHTCPSTLLQSIRLAPGQLANHLTMYPFPNTHELDPIPMIYQHCKKDGHPFTRLQGAKHKAVQSDTWQARSHSRAVIGDACPKTPCVLQIVIRLQSAELLSGTAEMDAAESARLSGCCVVQ